MVQSSGASFGNSNSFSHDALLFRVSNNFRILRCIFESLVYVIDVLANISYAMLCDEIKRNVNGLIGHKFVLSYVISDGPKCVIKNDRDTSLMMYSQRRLDGKFVSNDVIDDLVFDVIVEPVENFKASVRRPAEVGFDYVLTKNNKNEVTAEYKRRLLEHCKWRVHAFISYGNGAFYIRTLSNEYSYCGLVRDNRSSGLTSKVVAHLITDEVRANPAFSPKDVLEHIKVVYGFEISYWNAWKSRELAGKEVLGDDSASYNWLVRYLQVLKESNPGPYCVLEVDGASRLFQQLSGHLKLHPEIEKKLMDNAYFGQHFVEVKSNGAKYKVKDVGKVIVNVIEVNEVDDDFKAFEVRPPKTMRQVGRPKTRRFKPWVEGRRQMKCSRCGKKAGHNRKSYNEAI
ncbi:hypothetical protein LguiB_002239 [Lonicera macranthoides]